MYAICCMKSIGSYNRITGKFVDSCSWEEHIEDIKVIQDKIVFSEYDFAVIDEKLPWKDDAIELFGKKGIEIINFEGDFEETEIKIHKFIEVENAKVATEDKAKELENNSPAEESSGSTKTIEVEKEVTIEVPVYKQVYAGVQNKLIGVLNLSDNAGATFITLNLAKMISTYNVLTSVIESPMKPVIYETMGLEKKLGGKFYSYHKAIVENRKIERDRENICDDIVFIVPDNREYLSPDWDYSSMMKLIYSSKKASINFLDIGNYFENTAIQSIVDEIDILLVVIDPLQKKFSVDVQREVKKFSKSSKVIYIVNKWNTGYDKNNISVDFGAEDYIFVPFIAMETINKAVSNGIIPYSLDSVKDVFDKLFSRIIRELIPAELLKGANVLEKDNQKEVSKKTEEKIEYLTLGSNEIAFIGVSPCVGVTHMAIMFAYYLCSKYKVALVELNQNRTFLEIKNLFDDSNNQGNSFKSKGVDFYWNIEYSDFLAQHKDNYDFILLDLGCYYDVEELDLFLRADKNIVVGQAIDWKVKEIKRFYESTKKYDMNSKWQYFIPFLSDAELVDIRKLIKNKVTAIPFNMNPFIPSGEVSRVFGSVLGMKENKSKKNRFFDFIKK